jgi:hypothetical protein
MHNLSCNDLANISNNLGCCLGNALPLAEVNLTQAFSNCSLPIPAACTPPTESALVQFGLTIPYYVWTATSNNTEELTESIQKDFSILLGLPLEDISPTITPDAEHDSNTFVSVALQLNSDIPITSYQASLDQSITTMFTMTQATYSKDWPGRSISVYDAVVDITDNCQKTYAVFNNSGCYTLIANSVNYNGYNTTDFCATNCPVLTNNVKEACSAAWTLDDLQTEVIVYSDLACIRDGNLLCFSALDKLEYEGSTPDVDYMNTYCGSCISKLSNTIASWGERAENLNNPEYNLLFRAICLKDQDQYCFPILYPLEYCFDYGNYNETCTKLVCETQCLVKFYTVFETVYPTEIYGDLATFVCSRAEGTFIRLSILLEIIIEVTF